MHIFVFMTSVSFDRTTKPVNTYNSIIVTRIDSITPHQYDDIEAVVGEIDQLNIEYCCLWSGVMVLKLNKSSLYDSGDIHFYIKNVLHGASVLKKVDILHSTVGSSFIYNYFFFLKK